MTELTGVEGSFRAERYPSAPPPGQGPGERHLRGRDDPNLKNRTHVRSTTLLSPI